MRIGLALLGFLAFGAAASACRTDSVESQHEAESGPANLRAPEHDARCADGMVVVRHLESAFCIDTYEAPGFGNVPRAMTFDEAARYCSDRGADLCRDEDWSLACRGPDGLRYPYGNANEPGECQVEQAAVVNSGERLGCRSGFGVYDLSGNAAEWSAEGFLRGGDYAADEFGARCAARTRHDADDAPTLRTARCCIILPD